MGKISQVSSKYIVHSTIQVDGVVDRPDVIGAIFGQTEGLLGSDLELRELQRSGRIGRIEVNLDTRGGKSQGSIIIPSSMDKSETAIIGAALEIIQRIGPCNAKVKVTSIEDVRISKRTFVVERAKELLKNLMNDVMPDSQEIAEEVANAVRVMEVSEYGRDRLPCGPSIADSEEVIVVEGRADVLTLLRHGFKNVIAMNGTNIPPTISELSQQKEITVFVDGDRGGNLILRNLLEVAEIDFVTKAPDGKEVEELTKKEIHKALRSKITAEQAKHELSSVDTSTAIRKPMIRSSNGPSHSSQQQRQTGSRSSPQQQRRDRPNNRQSQSSPPRRGPPVEVNPQEKERYAEILEELVGTKGACLLDNKLKLLGKVPMSELSTTIQSLGSGVHAVVLDGSVNQDIVSIAERASLKHVIGMDSEVRGPSRVRVITLAEL